MQPTLGLFARREILILAMLTFSIIQACLKRSINHSDFNDIMILKKTIAYDTQKAPY